MDADSMAWRWATAGSFFTAWTIHSLMGNWPGRLEMFGLAMITVGSLLRALAEYHQMKKEESQA